MPVAPLVIVPLLLTPPEKKDEGEDTSDLNSVKARRDRAAVADVSGEGPNIRDTDAGFGGNRADIADAASGTAAELGDYADKDADIGRRDRAAVGDTTGEGRGSGEDNTVGV